jgi:hypothetical protein
MVRAPGPNPRAARTGPAGGGTQKTDQALQKGAHSASSDAAAPTDRLVRGRELHDRGMSDAAGSPGGVSRAERWRPEQTDDERQWEQTLAGEVHDF